MSSSLRSSGSRAPHRGRRLLTVAIAAGALALAACSSGGGSSAGTSASTGGASGGSSGSSGGKVTLTFWSWVPGIAQSVNLWNKAHPDIQVKLDETTSGEAGTYAKMFSALQAGNAPDLGQVEFSVLPNFEHVGGLVDLSKYGADSVKQDFVPWTWSQVSQGGGIYAIPQDTGPMGRGHPAHERGWCQLGDRRGLLLVAAAARAR